MMRCLRVLLLALASSALVLGPRDAFAADATEAELVQRGVALRRERKDAEALTAFRSAFALNPSPRTRAQIGFAEQATGAWVAAEEDLLGASGEEGDPWIARNRAAIFAALDEVRSHLASIDLTVNVDGAELVVNGEPRGTFPMESPVRVVLGDVTIAVRAPGYQSVEEALTLPAHAVLRQAIRLNALPSAIAAPPPLVIAPPPALAPPPPATIVRSQPAPGKKTTRTMPAAGWALLAGGGTLVGAGVVAHVMAANAASVYNDDGRCLYGGLSRDARCADYRRRAETGQDLAYVGYALGGASLVAAGILFALTPKDEHRAEKAITCAPNFGALGASCFGRF